MSSKDIEFLEQIAQQIENLPSEHLLHQAKTQEQIDEWHSMRRGNKIIAECWRAKFIDRIGDPIYKAVDNKEIDQIKYDGIWLLVKQYKALWDIIQRTERDVKTLHCLLRIIWLFAEVFHIPLPKDFVKYFRDILQTRYRFKSAYELFAEILKETENERFSECLKPYQEISINKGEKGLKQVKKFLEEGMPEGFYPLLTPIESQNLKNSFAWEKFSVSWMPITIMAAQFAAQNQPSLKDKLIKYNNLTIEMCNLGSTACRKRQSKTWPKLRSIVWINGKKVYGSKAGGVYR